MSQVLCPSCGAGNSEFNLSCSECGSRLPEALPRSTVSVEPRHGPEPGPVTDPLIGQRVARYEVLGKLGSGGMGTVYRATDVETGQQVAIKSVRMAQESLLPRLRREIHALARICHPGIVRILDNGTFQGLPWYAMELIEGPTLQDLTRQAVSGAQDLRDRLTLVHRLCMALAYLHGEGLIHRDLKPDNVLLRNFEFSVSNSELELHSAQRAETQNSKFKIQNSPWPVLVDFGMASAFSGAVGRDSLAMDSGFAGTPAYMAPEQIRGEILDARADLYALGCILYGLLTGRPPFGGKTPTAVLRGHLQESPVPVRQIVPEVPEPLEALVLRLLAKQRRDRLGHADDVAAALLSLGAENGLAPSYPRPRSYLYRSGFAGREDVLRQLEAPLLRLDRGLGSVVLVGGESGVGKTRLLLELARHAESRQTRVLSGECLPLGGTGLLHPLRRPLQAVADRCRDQGRSETERLLGRRGKVLGAYEPELATLPGQDELPVPAELPAAEARTRLFSALAETLAAFAEAEPTLLLLDDLQWADELTLGFLEFWAQTVGSRHAEPLQTVGAWPAVPVLLAGAYRTEEVGTRRDAPLQRLIERPGVERVLLGRLDEASVGAMVGDMLALTPPPPIFVRYLSRHSEGNPFFVGEYLRTAVAEKLLYRDAQARWQVARGHEEQATEDPYEALPIPGSLREMVGRRLERLSAEAGHLVEAAAVLGREVEEVLLAKMARLGGAAAMEGVEELLARQILEEVDLGRLRFAHDKIREIAYERIEAKQRLELHHAAAAAMDTQPESERARHLPLLGHHWERGGAPDRARPCYLAAARTAKDRYAHLESERLYRAYLALVEQPDAQSIAARNELGAALYHQWRLEESSLEHRLALEEAQRIGNRPAEAVSRCQVAITCLRSQQLEEACAWAERALVIARELGERQVEGRSLTVIANARSSQGREDEAQALYEQILALSRETGDRRLEGINLNNLALVHYRHGRLRQVFTLIEQALLIAREVGDRQSEGRSLLDLAMLHHDEGRIEQARALYAEALAPVHESGDQRIEGIYHVHTARLARQSGRTAEARQHLGSAEALLRNTSDREHGAIALCERGHLALAEGASASGHLREARSMTDTPGAGSSSGIDRALARLGRAQAAFEAGAQGRLFRGEIVEDLPETLRRKESERWT